MSTSSAQQGANSGAQGQQQQGQSTTPTQQTGGTATPSKPAVIRDWAAF